MAEAEAQALLESFKAAFYSEPTKVDECLAILPKIKIACTKFASMGVLQTDNVSPKEALLARACAPAPRPRPPPAFAAAVPHVDACAHSELPCVGSQARRTSWPRS